MGISIEWRMILVAVLAASTPFLLVFVVCLALWVLYIKRKVENMNEKQDNCENPGERNEAFEMEPKNDDSKVPMESCDTGTSADMVIKEETKVILRSTHKIKLKRPKPECKEGIIPDEPKSFLQKIIDWYKWLKADKNYRVVELIKGPKEAKYGFGFLLEGGLETPVIEGDTGIFVKAVRANSLASSVLAVGDRIISINGKLVKNLSLKAAVSKIRRAPKKVVLYVKTASKRQKMIERANNYERNLCEGRFARRQIEEFEDAFSMFDKQGSGKIPISNIFKLIRFLGYNLHEAMMWVYMNEQGIIGNRKVTFYELVQLMRVIVKEQNHNHDLKLAFSALDEDNKGYFTIEDLEEAFERMPGRERLGETEVNRVLDSADPNGDGIIDFKEFQNLVKPAFTMY